jgi:hypothetical protein
MAQGNTQASAQTIIVRACSWSTLVFDVNGAEVKPSVVEVTRFGRFEAWRLQDKAIIATVDPYHDEDVDGFKVTFYCFDSTSMRKIGVVLVFRLEDVVNHVKDALAHC